MESSNYYEPIALQSIQDSYSPPQHCGNERCNNLFQDFLLTVVLPSGLGLLLAICMALFLCCSGSSRKQQEEEQDIQFHRYDSVRRASLSLRQMSQKRDMPLMGSRSGSLTLDRDHRHRRGFRPRDTCQSAPGTLQRHQRRRDQDGHGPPPAYCPPPGYPEDDDDSAFLEHRRRHDRDVHDPPPGYPGKDDDSAFLDADIPLQELPVNNRGQQRLNSAPTSYNGYMTK